MLVLGWLAAFGRFWYQFIVGDDWAIAASIAAGLLAVYLLHRAGLDAWWLLPLVVIAALTLSLWRARGRRV
jgi:hypothetical protein